MKLTFKEFSTEKLNYTWLQKLCITLWAETMYLDYEYLQLGPGDPNLFHVDALKYLSLPLNSEEREDLGEWFNEGASYGGNKTLTKDLYDLVMTSAQEKTKKDLILYKYGDNSTNKPRWISMTILKGSHSNLGNEQLYHIKKGTSVIWTQKLADKAEVIIHSKYLE